MSEFVHIILKSPNSLVLLTLLGFIAGPDCWAGCYHISSKHKNTKNKHCVFHTTIALATVNADFQDLMRGAPDITNVVEACNLDGRQERLENMLSQLEMCEKALQVRLIRLKNILQQPEL